MLLTALGLARKIDLDHGNGVIDVGRRRAVVELAAQKSGWNSALPPGRGRDLGVMYGWGTYVAQIGGHLHVDRVVCAVDCGLCINPLSVEAQMPSAIDFGLAQALKTEITVSNGYVDQSNFNNYRDLFPDRGRLRTRATRSLFVRPVWTPGWLQNEVSSQNCCKSLHDTPCMFQLQHRMRDQLGHRISAAFAETWEGFWAFQNPMTVHDNQRLCCPEGPEQLPVCAANFAFVAIPQ